MGSGPVLPYEHKPKINNYHHHLKNADYHLDKAVYVVRHGDTGNPAAAREIGSAVSLIERAMKTAPLFQRNEARLDNAREAITLLESAQGHLTPDGDRFRDFQSGRDDLYTGARMLGQAGDYGFLGRDWVKAPLLP